MPEGLEAEIWRRAASALEGREITDAWVDARVAPDGFAVEVTGCRITGTRRAGKVLLLDTDGPTIGVHFGMTGRLEVDGTAPIERLEYASGADRPEWDRLRLFTSTDQDTPALRMNDPRRLGRVSLNPDLSHLGPDALTLTASELRNALAGRRAAIKTLLLDQSVVAGLGNLCADEVLYWAGVAPPRPADSLTDDELGAIATACREQLPQMLEAGGSTHGALSPQVRADGGPCPRSGGALRSAKIGGRRAVWSEQHQR